ncbi:hypothetical protein HPP92_019057 [Vanilla planifolia]|uniref:Polymerase nucleotidyl transferase domain-containing protein n=1 Tax=Vanilla planifolia TaxID=51239 RepID=A0A835QE44_VANPL|nr:hypothetical protein HPP92_019057 [Vanilla planifolia]
MGDLQLWPQQPDGTSSSSADSDPPLHPTSSILHPAAIGADTWRLADQATQEIIQLIQPTLASEQRRKAIVEYVQNLMRGFFSTEVFPFGSVPLKTYLPDGDIDLTVITFLNSEDTLVTELCSVLELEGHNKDARFEVKDVQYIHAEVKVVKCLVQNVVVDISFNQSGGLSTLCFLEQVDRFIGKHHLFKRSIILIKAWCYYESRILGAHHGLLSTYALEMLVLYIFHHFHSFLDGPFAVLFWFLDYYSKFDWDNYCISLSGPIPVSSLPELSPETAGNDDRELLLTRDDFLKSCVDSFSVAIRGLENNSRTFIKKHLNIVDPLRESNNLGRSVSKGNFYRIRSAFTYGARKLGHLLQLPDGNIRDEVNLFFTNTMDRHGSGERPDVQDLISMCQDSSSVEANGSLFVHSTDKKENTYNFRSGSHTTDAHRDLNEEIKNIKISVLDVNEGRTPLQKSSALKPKNGIQMESSGAQMHDISFGNPTSNGENCMASVSTCESGFPSSDRPCLSTQGLHVPESGNSKELSSDLIDPANMVSSDCVSINSALALNEEINAPVQLDSCEVNSSSHTSSWGISNNGEIDNIHWRNRGSDTSGTFQLRNEFADLSGDYEIHWSSLVYAQCYQAQLMGSYFGPFHWPPSHPYHQNKELSHGNMYAPLNANGANRPAFSPTFYYTQINQRFLSRAYGGEDVPKPRGTGTYLPNTRTHKERHSPGRGKNPMNANQIPRPWNNGRADMSYGMGFIERGPNEAATQTVVPVFGGNGRGKPPLVDIPKAPSRPALKGSPHGNVVHTPLDYCNLEFGSLGPVSLVIPTTEHGKKLDFINSSVQGAGIRNTASSIQSPVINSNSSRERSSETYLLKEDDFPPLSGGRAAVEKDYAHG